MAITTFIGNTNTGSNYTLYLQVEEVDISESANTSKLKYRAYLIGSSATSAYSGYNTGLTLTINVGDSSNATRYGNKTRNTIMDFGYGGVTCKTYYCNWNDSTGGNPNSTHTVSAMMGLSDWWTTGAISHGDDGNKTLKLKFTVSSLSGLVGSGTISTDFNMATIARASSVSFANSSYTISSSSSTAVPATITKSSTEFYHKLEYYLGSTSSTVKKTAYITKNSSSSVSDSSVKYSDLLDWITSTNKTNLYVVCTTYSDSNYTNSVGTSSRSTEIKITITASITTAAVSTDWRSSVPLGSSHITRLSSDLSTGIAGYSTLTLNSLSINVPTGATSLSFGTPSFTNGVTGKITIVSSTTSSYTIKIETNTLPLKADYYTSTVTSVVTDSRGNPVTLTLGTLAVAGYTKPTVTAITVNRAPDTTSTTADAAGLYFRVSCQFNPGIIKVNSSTYHAINGYSIKYTIGNTTATLASGSGSAGTGAGSFIRHTGNPTGSDRVGDNPPIGITETANITFSISDTFTGYSLLPLATAIVNTAKFPLDLSDNGSGTVGVGLGTIASSGYISLGLPLNTDLNFTSAKNVNFINASRIYWQENGWWDQFAIVPEFSGGDDSNKLKIQSAVGGRVSETSDPGLTDKITIAGKTGNVVCTGTITSGIDGNTDMERDLVVASGAGKFLMFSQAAVDGSRGLWLGRHNYVENNETKTAARKTFLRINKKNEVQFEDEIKFIHPTYAPTIADTASGIGCANKGSRYLVNELLTDGIVAPASNYTNNSFNTTGGTIAFYKYTGYSGGGFTGLTKTAFIDTDGIYRPKVSKDFTFSLTALAGYSQSTTVLRFKLFIPTGYTSVALKSYTAPTTLGAGGTSVSGSGTITLMSGTNDQNLDRGYVNVQLTTSSAVLTQDRAYVMKSGTVVLTLS